MSFLTKKLFWIDAAERAIKTFAQAAVAILTADAVGLIGVDYIQLLSIAGLAAVVSLLTSVASGSTGATDSASLVVDTKAKK